MCGNCGSDYLTDESDISSHAVGAVIPVMDKRGWTIGVGAIASLVGLGTVAAAAETPADKSYVQAPMVGDIYETDMRGWSRHPRNPG
jgi:hypothetical protein